MWELDCEESWAPKNWCFWTVVLVKTLESPLDCMVIQPVHSKVISPDCSLEGLMLKLKLQYFCHLMQRVDSLEKTLMLGGIGRRREGDDRGWDGWMASPTWWTWVWVNSGSWWWTGRPGVLQFIGSQRVGQDWATQLNWELVLACLFLSPNAGKSCLFTLSGHSPLILVPNDCDTEHVFDHLNWMPYKLCEVVWSGKLGYT